MTKGELHHTKATQDASISDAEVAATDAERQWVDYKAEYTKFAGNEFVGFISSVTSFGLFVQLPNTVEGLVRMVDLADDYYEYDEENMILFGRRTGREYHIGAPMRVRLAKVNKDLGQIDFVPVEATAKYEEVESDDGRKTKNQEILRRRAKRRSRKTRRSK